MAIEYKLFGISDNMNEDERKKRGFFPKIVRKKTVGIDDLAHSIGGGSTMRELEAKKIMEQMLYQIEQELLDGNHVNLEGFGSFMLTAQAKKPISSTEGVRAENIEVKRLAFKNSETLKRRLKRARFVRSTEK